MVEVRPTINLNEWQRFKILFPYTYPRTYKILSIIRYKWKLAIKRFIDILGSLLGIIIFLPLFIIIAIAIKLETPGPIFFTQRRLGKNKKPFSIIKFRTMVHNAEKKTGPVWARKNDPRITKVGRLLRQAHLDELPQLFNVLKGDMSLVGPRPEREEFVKHLEKIIPGYEKRFRVKPGITGLAQIRYKYDETIKDVKRKLRFDLIYIKNMCLRLDLRIIFSTFLIILKGKAVH